MINCLKGIFKIHINGNTFIINKTNGDDTMEYTTMYRKKDKGWQFIIQYKIDDKWKQKSKQGFVSKREAKLACEKALEVLQEEIKKGFTLNNEFSSITLKEFTDTYLIKQVNYQSAHSLHNMKYSIKSFSALHDMQLREIKSYNIQECIDIMVEKGFKYNTIKSKVDYLKALLNTAINYEIISENPIKNIRLPRNETPSKRRALTEKEENDLLNALKGSKYYLVVFIALKTGLRIGEILGLKYSDINFNENTISVKRQFKRIYDNTWGLGSLKSNNSNRVIPVTSKLINKLKTRMEDLNITNMDELIFYFGDKKSFQTVLNRRLKTLGFDVCLHELRHTYATKLIKSGLDLKTVAYLMGHDLKMTIEVYSHVTEDMLNKAKVLAENI
ncbi:tyrosine-type recombinase/integrase [Clostridium baratii]|uniref:tyrosine-type recombinase/integrase n=1 Tax=Clostridium baratii TaxID=1561 RepID=UPI0036F3BFA4